MQYGPTLDAIRQHRVPEWFQDAKLGIMIHWGLYSVPAFASGQVGPFPQSIVEHGFREHFKHNPYAEWYLNTMRIPGSPTAEYHAKTYGSNFGYDDFIPRFDRAAEQWDPAEWAALFERSGARYVVQVSKHSDAFCLWPSRHPHPLMGNRSSRRNIVGELAGEVRKRGLKMGLYYCTGMDWNFKTEPIYDLHSALTNCPLDPRYRDHCRDQLFELIELFAPSILWADVGYPPDENLPGLIAHYYNQVPEGVVNDRMIQPRVRLQRVIEFLFKGRRARAALDALGRRILKKGGLPETKPLHCDFHTPEYTTYPEVRASKWETVRGIGHSFGYNRFAPESDYISLADLIRTFVDVVSKNGNMLLNVGPDAEGRIIEIEKDRLLGLGRWLEVNAEAVFGTRPWQRAEGKTADGREVRFTAQGNTLYAILLDGAQGETVTIKSLGPFAVSRVSLLGSDRSVAWKWEGADLALEAAGGGGASPRAYKIEPG